MEALFLININNETKFLYWIYKVVRDSYSLVCHDSKSLVLGTMKDESAPLRYSGQSR